MVYSAHRVYNIYSIHHDSVLFHGVLKVEKIPSDENLYGDHTPNHFGIIQV
jgi:hypothetical protein